MSATSSGQHLLMPNRPPSTRKEQSVMVEISSRDRNYNNLILSNPMRFQFQRPLKDVRSVELISGTIPANPCQINSENNKFVFQEGSTPRIITIPPGYYSLATLLAQMQSLINGSGVLSTYTLSVSTKADGDHVLFSSDNTSRQYSLQFLSGTICDLIDQADGYLLKENTPSLLLGFDISDYYSSSGLILSPFPADLNTALTRLYLYIDFNNSQSLATIERGAGRRSPFAIIYLDTQTNGYKFLNKETVTPVNFSLPQPFSRLQALNIEFRDEFYRLINFNGKDFSLLLQLNCLE
jgi:hypothetical protein